jgi:hypothetical protein
MPQLNELFSSTLHSVYQQRWLGELKDTVLIELPNFQTVWDAVLQWYVNIIESK